MVKVKKEVWEEVCDFCEETKTGTCNLCGKDLCNTHSLLLQREYTCDEYYQGRIFIGGKTVVGNFCPDHLGLELTNKYNDSCKGSKIK